jgi:pimeloyl-ACP methyl ester carboxylesterase
VRADIPRRPVHLPSGRIELAAWHYPGSNGACVVMAGGFGVTKEPGTDRFAQRFAAAGFTVLAFDHRGFGGSGGRPRQVAGIRAQLADWQAALAFAAAGLPEVAADRIAAWGFSSAGGHVLRIAARTPGLAAAIAQSPNADGRAAARNAAGYQTPGAFLRLLGRGALDALGGPVGRAPLLVPLSGEPGTVAMLTTPDSRDGDRALDPDGEHGDWVRAVAARSVLGVGFYRPGRDASRIRCPLLVVVADDDRSALAAPAVRAAERAPRGELVRLPGGHYAPFLDAHEQAVAAELDFLQRHLVDAPAPAHAG